MNKEIKEGALRDDVKKEIRNFLKKEGYSDFNKINTKLSSMEKTMFFNNPDEVKGRYYIEDVKIGNTIYKRGLVAAMVIFNPGWSKKTMVVFLSTQSSSGSADAKLPYLVESIKILNSCICYFILEGKHWSEKGKKAKAWMGNQVNKVNNLRGVGNLSNFKDYLRKCQN